MDLNNNCSLYAKTLDIQQLYDINQVNIIKAYKAQNNNSFEESVHYLEKIKNNFYMLGNIIDKTNHGPIMCRENREILSFFDIKNYLKDNPNFKLYNIQRDISQPKSLNYMKSSIKEKQHKSKWTKEEEAKFYEGLEKYGKKNTKAISEYIGTRNVSQVRSKLQKSILKLQKKNDNNNNNSNLEKLKNDMSSNIACNSNIIDDTNQEIESNNKEN